MIVNIRRERCPRNLWSSKIQTDTSWSSQTRQQVPQELLPRPVWFWRDDCRVCSRDAAIAVPLLSGWGLESIRTLTSRLFTLESLNWLWVVWGQIQVRSDEQGWPRGCGSSQMTKPCLGTSFKYTLWFRRKCSVLPNVTSILPTFASHWVARASTGKKMSAHSIKTKKSKNRKSIGPRWVCSYCLS